MSAFVENLRQALGSISPDALREELRKMMEDPSFRGVISYARAEELAAQWGMSISQLMLALTPVASAYATPAISNFHVGAVAQGSTTGALYYGANMEFVGAALSFTTHAEQSAVTNAWLHGEQGLLQLAIDAAPCGYCRQFLWEISTAEKLAILLNEGTSGALSAFLPQPFGPKDLKVEGALMLAANNGLVLDEGTSDPVVLAALDAANSSYAPPQYSGSYAGVALSTQAEEVFAGRYAENAAFNPSMSPLESALVMWNFATRGADPVRRVALVQIDGARADQSIATGAVVESLRRTAPVELDIYSAHVAAE